MVYGGEHATYSRLLGAPHSPAKVARPTVQLPDTLLDFSRVGRTTP